jgi:hypothetical protein
MTTEQRREQWLKRVLPALVVLVVYFSVVSPNYVIPRAKKAEEQYQGLVKKGISESAFPGLEKQQSAVREIISQLEAEGKLLKGALQTKDGFLSRSETINARVELISTILVGNHLQVLNEDRNDKPGNDLLPGSLRETQTWLKDLLSLQPEASAMAKVPAPTAKTSNNSKPNMQETDGLNLWTIRYVGTYLDNYHALSTLAASNIKALRVSLTMHPHLPGTDNTSGLQEWVLTLWL